MDIDIDKDIISTDRYRYRCMCVCIYVAAYWPDEASMSLCGGARGRRRATRSRPGPNVSVMSGRLRRAIEAAAGDILSSLFYLIILIFTT